MANYHYNRRMKTLDKKDFEIIKKLLKKETENDKNKLAIFLVQKETTLDKEEEEFYEEKANELISKIQEQEELYKKIY